MKAFRRFLLLTSLLAWLAAGRADAQILSIDFNADSPATLLQAGFQTFYVPQANTPGPLSLDYTVSDPSVSSGAITLSLAQGTNFINFAANTAALLSRARATPTNSGAFTYSALYRDFAIATGSNTTLQLQLSQLDANTAYQLTFYIYDGNATASSGTETVVNRTGGGTSVFGAVTYQGGAPLTSNSQFSTTSTATSDGTGKLLFSFTNTNAASGGQGIINGLVITAVPEPSSGLLGLTGALLLARRRRIRRGA